MLLKQAVLAVASVPRLRAPLKKPAFKAATRVRMATKRGLEYRKIGACYYIRFFQQSVRPNTPA
jgi:hypothetical protein